MYAAAHPTTVLQPCIACFSVGDHRGKHSKTSSPFENEAFREKLRQFVKENGRMGGAVLTLSQIKKWIGEELNLPEEDWYSENTVMRWIHALGFAVRVDKKQLYVDGHERPDVVESRLKFMAGK